jgi:hypothetical protein
MSVTPINNGEIKAYPTLELLQINEKPTVDTIVRRFLHCSIFKTENDLVGFVNQNNLAELVEISFNPHMVNVIGGLPWKLFYWVYAVVGRTES